MRRVSPVMRSSLVLAMVLAIFAALAAFPASADAASGLPHLAGRESARQETGTISPGSSAVVRGDGDCLRVRAAPTLGAAVLDCIPDGSTVAVLDGPIAADGYDWVQVQQSSTVGWAASVFLEPAAAASTAPSPDPPAPTETPEPEDNAEGTPPPAVGALSGSIPVAGGVGLVVWGGTSAGLASEVAAHGCDFVSAWASNDRGGFVGYLDGAPALVNRDWMARFPEATVPAGTPLAIVCRRASVSAAPVVIPAAPTTGPLRGVPSSGGVGLSVWSGTIAALATEAASSGCTLVSAWAAGSGGQLVGYVVGALDIVNRRWLDEKSEAAVPDGTPLVIVCRRPSTAAEASPPASQGSAPAPTARPPAGVPPDWRTRPPGPAGNE